MTRVTVSLKRARLFETEDEANAVAAASPGREVLYKTREGFIVWDHRYGKWIAEDNVGRRI